MASLRKKSCNGVVQLTSKLIQSFISVNQVRWAPLGVSLQADRVRDPGADLTVGRSSWRGWRADRGEDSSKDLFSSLCLWMCSRPTHNGRLKFWAVRMFLCSSLFNFLFVTTCEISVYCNISADMKLINSKMTKCFFFLLSFIKEAHCIYYLSSFVNTAAFRRGKCRFFVLFLVLLRYAALNFHFFVLSSSSKVTLTFPSWSLLFPPHSLVSTAILCYTGFMIFVLEG